MARTSEGGARKGRSWEEVRVDVDAVARRGPLDAVCRTPLGVAEHSPFKPGVRRDSRRTYRSVDIDAWLRAAYGRIEVAGGTRGRAPYGIAFHLMAELKEFLGRLVLALTRALWRSPSST